MSVCDGTSLLLWLCRADCHGQLLDVLVGYKLEHGVMLLLAVHLQDLAACHHHLVWIALVPSLHKSASFHLTYKAPLGIGGPLANHHAELLSLPLDHHCKVHWRRLRCGSRLRSRSSGRLRLRRSLLGRCRHLRFRWWGRLLRWNEWIWVGVLDRGPSVFLLQRKDLCGLNLLALWRRAAREHGLGARIEAGRREAGALCSFSNLEPKNA
mmetsp:Transcript_29648/g.69005  ORF Transcript_29648/g.69005 Transcript_29648/m.69005 type:complete len:210 (+) Transcript_29648:152-781(+)